MKCACAVTIFAQGAKQGPPLSHSKQGTCDTAMGKKSCQPSGLCPKSAACRSAEQGPRSRDATVEPIVGAYTPIPLRVCGVRSQREPSSALRRAPLAGMRPRRGAWDPRNVGAPVSRLRGRIQAKNAWNLLRPARDSVAGLANMPSYSTAARFALSTVLAATHVRFIVLGALSNVDEEFVPWARSSG